MNSQAGFATLADDQGTPVRWKVTTILAVAGLLVSLVLQIARAGAKSERLDALSSKVKELEGNGATLVRLETRQEEMIRRQDATDKKVDLLLERRGR